MPHAALRALPLAVLSALVVSAIAHRGARRVELEVPASATFASSAIPKARLAAPLRGVPTPSVGVTQVTRMLHGDVRHTHRAEARGPSAVRLGWRTSVGGAVAAQVTTSPDEETLYVATLAGELRALARADGARRWSVPLGERAYGTPLVHGDGTIFVGSDANRFAAIRPDGTVLWRLEVEGEADTSAIFASDDSVVFAAGSQLYAVRRGGDVAWRVGAGGKIYTSPALDDGRLVFGAQDDAVYGVDPGGKVAFRTDLGADVDGGPAIGEDGAIFVGTDKGEVVRLDRDGHVVWRSELEGFVRGTLAVAHNGDVLAGTYGPVPRVVRLSPDGRILGAFAIPGTGAREFGIHGAPLEDAAGTLYFGAQDDTVYALGVDGAVAFRFTTKADVDAPVTMLRDGSLVVASEDGTVSMLLP